MACFRDARKRFRVPDSEHEVLQGDDVSMTRIMNVRSYKTIMISFVVLVDTGDK
jgi:hypothetical protein